MKSESKEWREFEKLVARIEATVAPLGAVVRSPDEIIDLVTGSSRNVDASIRYTIGSVPILITVEARHRNDVQDDTWIEQLAKKREKLGAAKTIAVSLNGFSEPAKKTARLNGIELRDLREIDSNEIESWLRTIDLTNILLHLNLKRISAEIDTERSGGGTVHIKREKESVEIRALIRVCDQKFVSPYDLLNMLIQSPGKNLPEVPLDGTKMLSVLTAQLPDCSLQAQTAEGPKFIRPVSFELECYCEKKIGSVSGARYFEYASPDGKIIHRVEFQTDVEGASFILGVQRSLDAPCVRISISRDSLDSE